MDAAAVATLALLALVRTGTDARGHATAVAIVDVPAGSVVEGTRVDGCRATPRGPTRRSNVAWALAFDPGFASRERFRDARQLALYFVSHVQEGDAMSVVVTTAGEPERRASGFHGIGELTTLRAPLDATLDPAARRKGADAGDLLTFAREESLRAPAPPGDLFLHVAVALEEEDASPATRVRVTGEALDLRETLAEGTSQSRGPRLVAEIAARLAGTSRLELDLACPTTSEPPPAPEASSPSRSWMDAVLLALAAIGLAFALGAVVWRRLRRG